ncbi:MAG TPA: amidohydrolase family protein [Thermoplasmataceae archaeon]|nr:amidohydrolase family protein [Thermoplasmatales archaeon AK]HLH85746.1 amidohydrolase family protein [Thermoplasmataceae archaeon]
MLLQGRIFDGESFIENGEVQIDENSENIEFVNERRSKISRVEDKKLSDEITIMPALIDAHIHFFGTKNYSLLDWVLTPDVMLTINSVNDARKLIDSGFTTVRALGDKVSLDMSKAEKLGLLIGPRIISAGYSLACTGGNDDPKSLPLEIAKKVSYSYYCDGPWECRKAVRTNLRNGAEVIKAYASTSFVGGGIIRPELTEEELAAIAEESHHAKIKAAVHAYGSEALNNSIEAGFDSIEHGLGLTEDIAEEIKKRGIFYVPTLAVYKRKREDKNSVRDEMIRRHIEKEMEIAGRVRLKIAAGTDYVGSLNEPHGQNYLEVKFLSETLGNIEALKSATSRAADCLGLSRIGTIAPGKEADLILVRGDPGRSISALSPDNILMVIKRGRVVKNILSQAGF